MIRRAVCTFIQSLTSRTRELMQASLRQFSKSAAWPQMDSCYLTYYVSIFIVCFIKDTVFTQILQKPEARQLNGEETLNRVRDA